MDTKNIIEARDCYNFIIGNFPEDLSIIDKLLKDKETHIAVDMLSHMNTLFLNDLLNNEHLLSESEKEYIYNIRKHIANKVSNIRDKDFLDKKGELNKKQLEKYSKKETIKNINKNKNFLVNVIVFLIALLIGLSIALI